MKTMNLRLVGIVICAGILTGCAHVQTTVLHPVSLKYYKRIYIEPPQEDEFVIVPALAAEFNRMGFEVLGVPFSSPTDTDLLVRVTPIGGWDIVRYLQSVQLQFVAAKSGRMISTLSFYSKGAWLGVRDARLKILCDDLRKKYGYPLES
jgi:hypothetical protein